MNKFHVLVLAAASSALAQDTRMTTIDPPQATASQAWAVNSFRDVVGFYTLPDKTNRGFVMRLGQFTSIQYPGAMTTDAFGLNDRGDVVGDYTVNGVTHGYLLSGGKFTTIDYPGSISTALAQINNNGDIAAEYTSTDKVTHGFLYSQGKFTSLDYPGAVSTIANGLNDRGDIVLNFAIGGITHGALYRNGLYTPIDVPGAQFTGAYGINAHGEIVGRFRDAAGATHAYTLTADGKMTTIDVPGATFTGGGAINRVGDIVGRYTKDGVIHGYLFRIPPVTYTLTDLTTLPGGKFSMGAFIDRNGVVTGISDVAGGAQHAVIWQGGKIFDVSKNMGVNSGAYGLNRFGQALAQGESAASDPNKENFCAFGTGMKCLGYLWQGGISVPLPTLGGNNAAVGNINNRGEAIGVAETAVRDPACYAGIAPGGTGPQTLQFQAVVWGPRTGDIRQLYPYRSDTVAEALWINDNGQATGASGTCANTVPPPYAAGQRAVLWEADGSVRDLGNLGGTGNAVAGFGHIGLALNNRGHVVGASALPGNHVNHGFLWTPELGMRDLGTLPGDEGSGAVGINERDEMSFISMDAEGEPRGCVWRNGEITDLNTVVQANAPLHVLWSSGINDRGEIAGFGVTRTGDVHAFVAVPNGSASSATAILTGSALPPVSREAIREGVRKLSDGVSLGLKLRR